MDIRYLILDKHGNVLYKIKSGQRFGQWDFTLPGDTQGGRALDLYVMDEETKAKWLAKI